MDKTYDHKKIEKKIYQLWLDSGYFNPDNLPDAKNRKPFAISLPPPNVTGILHMGHAFEDTIQDVLIRFHRMNGKKALWIPGTDHAAIATQSKFEAEFYKKTGKFRHDFSREKFFAMIQEFALSNQSAILNQLHKLGLSLDWSRLAFTLDQPREKAVRTAFKRMYEAGLIYRGNRIVNWDPKAQTTVADDEIEYKEQKDPFYYFQYGPFVIGTVRPETKFGDKYVVINPDDTRYKKFKHGEKINLEWINGPITATIIKDHAVDPEVGSGVMTITPAHSAVDFEIAKRHNLDVETIIDDRGILLPIAGEFAGQHIKKARPLIVEKLKKKGVVVKVDENYVHNIAVNYRGGGIIEPQIKKQWFVDVNREFTIEDSKISGIATGSQITLRELMHDAVKSGAIDILPKRFEKTYFHWIDNLRDWCISRQIIYGHQIPVWYKNSKIYCGLEAPKDAGWKQDPDTLDTWFSSGLWTFSILGWPDKTQDLNLYHPNSVMVPGYEILFFWVARMILMSGFLLGEVPFKKVYLHGIVRDKQGRKFSKSLNNGVNPLDMIEKYGTDALRMALIFGSASGNDVIFDENKLRGMKHFANKLWNMARFIKIKRIDDKTIPIVSLEQLERVISHESDKKMIEQVRELIKATTNRIEDFRLHEASQEVYEFAWHEFADKYIEDVKNRIDEASYTSLVSIFSVLLKLLHPFMPFITEEIYQTLPGHEDSIMISSWPKA